MPDYDKKINWIFFDVGGVLVDESAKTLEDHDAIQNAVIINLKENPNILKELTEYS